MGKSRCSPSRRNAEITFNYLALFRNVIYTSTWLQKCKSKVIIYVNNILEGVQGEYSSYFIISLTQPLFIIPLNKISLI